MKIRLFRDLRIRHKVALMGGILIVAFLYLGGSFVYNLRLLRASYTMLDESRAAMQAATEFISATQEMEADLRGYLATGSPAAFASFREAQTQAGARLRALRGSIASTGSGAPIEQGIVRQVTLMEAGLRDWDADTASFLARRRDSRGDAAHLMGDEARMGAIRKAVEAFYRAERSFTDARWLQASATVLYTLRLAVVSSILVLLLVLLGFSALAGSIVEPLLQITDRIQAIAAGDYTQRVPIPGRSELGQLAAAFNVMAENLEAAQREQESIRTRLESLNQFGAQVSRSLYARDRAEAVVMTLQRDFGASFAQVLLPEGRQGWVCVEIGPSGPVEYRLYSSLPENFAPIAASRGMEQRVLGDSGEVEWTCPLLRGERPSGILRVRFPADEWSAAEPLLNSINRFCTNAFELARAYELVSGERHRLDAILSSTGEGVLVRDRDGRVVLANPAAIRVLNLGDRPVLGLPLEQVLEGEVYADLRHFIETTLSNATGPEQSNPLPMADRFITATRAPIRDGGLIGAVTVIRDITQQVEVDRMKSEFISIVSHELRTPLTSIKGSLGLLLGGAGGDIPPKMRQLLQIAQNNTDRLIRLINDILDISKIEAGRVQMAREPVDVAEVVRSVVEGLEGMSSAAGVHLQTAFSAAPPLTVSGDRDRIVQVVTNLLSNALKFSPRGSTVGVRAGIHDSSVLVEVIDHGPGIPYDAQAKLFRKFYQIDSSSARAKGGTGLGLAISHAIVREHGGQIGVESAEGQGSRFWFSLPVPRPSAPRSEGAGEAPRPRALVCDDDPDIANLIAMLLERSGYECQKAYSGQQALDLAREKAFDFATLDLSMPDMDGIEVARRLQADPATRSLPLVFVSAYEQSPDARSLRIAGWVTKPIDEQRFGEAIRRAAQLGEDGTDHEDGEAPLVLLVDDDPDVLQVVGQIVESAGMRAARARSGLEALDKIRKEGPDAVVLDLMMPGLDGFGVVGSLRNCAATRHLPVLVLTAKDLSEEERGRLHLGETRFLTKTYASQEAILDDLAQLLQAGEDQAATTERQT